jgi:hypothetical protein
MENETYLPIKETDHVDYFIWNDFDDSNNRDYAKFILMHFRLPGIKRALFRKFLNDAKLFCDYKGVRNKIIGASRFGDVWITSKLDTDGPYENRVNINDCSNFGKEAFIF